MPTHYKEDNLEDTVLVGGGLLFPGIYKHDLKYSSYLSDVQEAQISEKIIHWNVDCKTYYYDVSKMNGQISGQEDKDKSPCNSK